MPVHLTPSPPYSPVLAPSYSFLFEYVKSTMLSLELDSPDELFDWIRGDFHRISGEALEKVFASWITLVQNYIECQGPDCSENDTTRDSISSKMAFGGGGQPDYPSLATKRHGSKRPVGR
jgi:hypothetical protein